MAKEVPNLILSAFIRSCEYVAIPHSLGGYELINRTSGRRLSESDLMFRTLFSVVNSGYRISGSTNELSCCFELLMIWIFIISLFIFFYINDQFFHQR